MVRFYLLLWQVTCEQDGVDCGSGNLILLNGDCLRMN